MKQQNSTKNGVIADLEYFNSNDKGIINSWLNGIDWYLEEVELADLIELPTEDEIFTRAGEYEKEASYGLAAAYVNDDFCQGAKWAIEQIKNRNKL